MFLFSDAVQQSFAAGMNSPEMRDNPFAAIGQVLAKSVRVEPGVALYLLVIVMVALTLVWKLSWLDRLAVADAHSAHDSNVLTRDGDRHH